MLGEVFKSSKTGSIYLACSGTNNGNQDVGTKQDFICNAQDQVLNSWTPWRIKGMKRIKLEFSNAWLAYVWISYWPIKFVPAFEWLVTRGWHVLSRMLCWQAGSGLRFRARLVLYLSKAWSSWKTTQAWYQGGLYGWELNAEIHHSDSYKVKPNRYHPPTELLFGKLSTTVKMEEAAGCGTDAASDKVSTSKPFGCGSVTLPVVTCHGSG